MTGSPWSNVTTQFANNGGTKIQNQLITNPKFAPVILTGQLSSDHVLAAQDAGDSGWRVLIQQDGVYVGNGTSYLTSAMTHLLLNIITSPGTFGLRPSGVNNSALQVVNNTNAVNGLQIDGTITGVQPVLQAAGSDSNIGIVIQPKGSGVLSFTALTTLQGGTKTTLINSGSLSTKSFSSGIGAQVSAVRDTFVFVPVTYTPTAGAAATCLVELSPDNSTYSTLRSTETVPLGTALDSFIRSSSVWVPAAWYVRAHRHQCHARHRDVLVMATYYAVGNGTNWSSTGSWSTTSGSASGYRAADRCR